MLAPGAENGGVCARCGRGFRGDWDRVPTVEGVWCNTCANRVDVVPPARPGPVAAAASVIGGEEHDARQAPSAKSQEPAKRHGALFLLAGLAVLAISVIVIPPLQVFLTQRLAGAQDPRLAAPAQQVATAPLFFLNALLLYARYLSALFLALHFLERLPNESFGANLISVGVVAGGLCLLSLIGVNLYFWVVVIVAQFWLLTQLYDLGLWDFCICAMCYLGLGPLFWAVERLAQGGIALMVL